MFKKLTAYSNLDIVVKLAETIISCNSATSASYKSSVIPSLSEFIANLAKTTQVGPAILFLPLVYFNRLKKALPPTARGNQFALD